MRKASLRGWLGKQSGYAGNAFAQANALLCKAPLFIKTAEISRPNFILSAGL